MIIIGIDPGLTGAIAFVSPQGGCVIEDIPTQPLPGNGMVKCKVDGLALARMVRKHCPVDAKALVVCEAVHAMPGNAIQTQGSLMRSLGAIESVFEVLRFPLLMVQSQVWKRHFGLKAEKAQSLRIARTLYPECQEIARAKDHNRAESLLIAHYAKQVMA